MYMNPTFNLTENKIKSLLDEFNQDREKLFSDLKMSSDVEAIKEKKIKQLEVLIKDILTYKKLLLKDKANKEKDS